MKHATGYVIDLETAATTVDAVILSIGVVEIDMRALALTGRELYVPVDRPSQRTRFADPTTIHWWGMQNAAAWDAAWMGAPRVKIDDALDQMSGFIGREAGFRDTVSVWGNGPEFDVAILNHAIVQYRLPQPWPYNAARCVRTLLDVAGLPKGPFLPGEIAHHALHDARREARDVIAALRFLQQRIAA